MFDPNELAAFERLAPVWWEKTGPCQPLHVMNPARLQFMTDQCRLEGLRILDLGCGGGILSESMARRGAHVTGLDISPKLLEVAIEHAQIAHLAIDYVLSTTEKYAASSPEPFDVITCMELLEHHPAPPTLVQAIAQLIKPEGHIFFSTINRTPQAFLGAIVGAEYCLKLLPKGTHHYAQFIKPSELAAILREHQLYLKALSGLTYRPFTQRAFLSTSPAINYLAYATPRLI